MKKNLDYIISESISNYLNKNLIKEGLFESEKDDNKSDDDKKDSDEKEKDSNGNKPKKKKKKKFRKNAIKGKGGLRKDFDTEDDETYNANVDDQEESSIIDVLNNGYVNVSAVAQKLYPDHTKEGAQSQLRKKLEGETSDSGSIYKLKNREVKSLRSIIASFLK